MGRPKRILVVDDEAVNRTLLKGILKARGHQCEEAANGTEALGMLDSSFDLVLLDIMMPGMDGYELADRIRNHETCSDIPIVMVTALSGKEDRLRAVAAGVNDFVTKPIDHVELRVRMDSLLKMKEAQDAIKEHRSMLEATVAERTKALRESEYRLRDLYQESKRREELYSSVLNSSADGIVICDLEERVQYVSPSFTRLFGWTLEELQKNPAAFVPDSERKSTEAIHKRIRENGAPVSGFPTKRLTNTGKTVHVSMSASLYRDYDGAPAGMLLILTDISERVRAEHELVESEERMRLLIEASPIGIKIVRNGEYSYVNPALASMFGYDSPEEIIGRRVEDLYAPQHWDLVREGLGNHNADDISGQFGELKGLKRDGKPFDLVLWRSQLEFRDGSAFLGFLLDVTEEKSLRRQLFQAQKMQAVGTLAGGIAHDFNNILSVIIGYVEMGLLDVKPDTRLNEYLTQVLEAGERASDLVRQILTFSRYSEEQRKPILLRPIVNETIKFLRVSIPKNIEMRHRLNTDTNAILAAPTQIHQVLMNLCTNAAHSMRQNGGLLEVTLANVDLDSDFLANHPRVAPGRFVRLTVKDQGHGIPMDMLDRVFDPYFTTKKPGEGTGLGLSVVHGIVENHGGLIVVDSAVGKGTKVQVFWPTIDKPEASETAELEELPTGSERALIVDDEPPIARLTQQMLQRLGYDATCETSAEKAIRRFRDDPNAFDLIITDFSMPKMSGVELASEILKLRPDIPVVLCTGFSDRITEKQAAEIGIERFITKPVRQLELARTIRCALDEPARKE